MDDFQIMYTDSKLWILGLLIGLILCFFGSQIFFKSLFVFGFLALSPPGFLIGSQAYGALGSIIGLILGGIVGGLIFIALYQVGLFTLGFLVGGAAGLILTGGTAIPIIIGIISGIVFIAFTDAFIVFGTALLGAYIIGESLVFVIAPAWLKIPGLMLALKMIMFVAGMLTQVSIQGK